MPAGRGVYEYASQRRLSGAGKVVVTVDLDAFDLRVVGVE